LIKVSSNSSGFTIAEIIIAITIISIAIIPMMKSFGPAIMATASVEKTFILTNQAKRTMDRLLSLDFDTLKDNIGIWSCDDDDNNFFDDPEDPCTFLFKGIKNIPVITIIDASGDESKTLLELQVAIDGLIVGKTGKNYFSTLKADY
jgi:type II secretory pathway pseudopilin PulG